MRKFKRIFYPIYFVVILLVLIISFNIYEALELFKVWGWFKYFSDLPYMGRDLMIFLCALMLIEIAAENFQIADLKSRKKSLEQQVTELKAKLYDKSQVVVIEQPEEPEGEKEEWGFEEDRNEDEATES